MSKNGDDDRLRLVREALELGGALDVQMSNLVVNGESLKNVIPEYSKQTNKIGKAWFKELKDLVKKVRKASARGRESYERMLKKERELRKDGKFTAYSMAFKDAMEALEDVEALCTRYDKFYRELFTSFGFSSRDEVIRRWTYLVSYDGYATAYRDAYKAFAKVGRKVGALRT